MSLEMWDSSEFFFIHFCGRGSHFPDGHLEVVQECTKIKFSDFSRSLVSYFSSTICSLTVTQQRGILPQLMEESGGKTNAILIKILSTVVVFSDFFRTLVSHFSTSYCSNIIPRHCLVPNNPSYKALGQKSIFLVKIQWMASLTTCSAIASF